MLYPHSIHQYMSYNHKLTM